MNIFTVTLAGILGLAGGGAVWADGPPTKWAMPTPSRTVVVHQSIVIPAGESVDFKFTRFVPTRSLGDGSQREAQRPVIILMPGASVRRVIIGRPGADGIHCRGNNVLRDVWFEDVGEDAVTVDGPHVQWIGGGARRAEDKIVQLNHKGPFLGENLYFEDFTTGVRGNGNKEFKRTPFRVLLRNIGAKKGVCLLRFSNRGARGEIRGIYTQDLRQLGRADGGSKIVRKE
ncbi:MAG: pectate lyase [Verrucomicrobiales bacterium]